MFTHGTIPIINQRTVNSVADFEDFHLSYNPSSVDYGSDTTAFVVKQSLFLILNGDHKAGMHAAAETGGVIGALDYYISNIDQANFRSSHKTAVYGDPHFSDDKIALDVFGEDGVARLRAAIESLT
jgi:hypothetical protein